MFQGSFTGIVFIGFCLNVLSLSLKSLLHSYFNSYCVTPLQDLVCLGVCKLEIILIKFKDSKLESFLDMRRKIILIGGILQ